MSGDFRIAFIYKIRLLYSHERNVSFLKYFDPHFLDDKCEKSLELQETQKARNLLK